MACFSVGELAKSFQAYASASYRKPSGRPTRAANNVRDAMRELVGTPWPPGRVGDLPVDAVTVRVLRAVQDAMVSSGRLCRSTINDRVNCIRRMFRWAVGEGLLDDASIAERLALVPPLRRGRCAAAESPGVSSVPESRVRLTLEALADELTRCTGSRALGRLRLSTMIETHWLTGMRPAELCGMRRSLIRELVDGWEYRPDEHKTEHLDKPRVIVIGPEAQCVLRPWMHRAGADVLFAGSRAGVPMRALSYYRAICRVNERHGIGHWHPNQIRHAFITRMAETVGMRAAQNLAGHSQQKTTEGYTDITPEVMAELKSIMRRVG